MPAAARRGRDERGDVGPHARCGASLAPRFRDASSSIAASVLESSRWAQAKLPRPTMDQSLVGARAALTDTRPSNSLDTLLIISQFECAKAHARTQPHMPCNTRTLSARHHTESQLTRWLASRSRPQARTPAECTERRSRRWPANGRACGREGTRRRAQGSRGRKQPVRSTALVDRHDGRHGRGARGGALRSVCRGAQRCTRSPR